HARIAHVEGVVLRPAAEDLDRPVNLRPAADQRVDLAVEGLLVEVDAELVERGILLSALLGLLLALAVGLLGALRGTALELAPTLADAVADVADRVEPAHVLLLQEIDRVGIALGEQRDEHVGPG